MAADAEAAAELPDVESLPRAADVTGALTADNKERTETAVFAVLIVSEELDGGEPGGVVLKGISRLCRALLSALTAGAGFGSPVSSASLVCILDRLSSVSSGTPARFRSFWQISNPRRRLGRAGSSPEMETHRNQRKNFKIHKN